jgi:PAS domain S-box-containing protein
MQTPTSSQIPFLPPERQIAAMQAQVQLLQSIWETVDYGVFVLDVIAESNNFQCIYRNPACEKIPGFSAHSAMGQLEAAGPEPLADPYQPYAAACIATGKSIVVEVTLPHNQSETWWQLRLNPLTTAGGAIEQLVGTMTNISDRKRVELNCQACEQRYRAIVNTIPDLMFWLNAAGIFLGYVTTEAFTTLFSATESPIGQHLNDVLPPEMAERQMHYIQQALATRQMQLYEQQLNFDGRLQFEEVRVLPFPNGEVLFVIRDITDRKRQEDALRNSEAQNRALLTAMPDLIFRLNSAGIYLGYVTTHQFVDLLPRDIQPIGKHVTEFLPPAIAEHHQVALRQTLATGEMQIYEQVHDLETGKQYEEVRVVPCGNDEAMFIIRDISDRKRSEVTLYQSTTQLQQQAAELECALSDLKRTQTQLIQTEKMSALGQLVAGVAHEINNPVSFIYGNLEHATAYIQDLLVLIHLYQQHYPAPPPDIAALIAEINLPFLVKDLPKLLGSMQIGADRIEKIVQSLRSFSRTDEAECKAIDLHQGIDSTLVILENRLKAQGAFTGIQVIKEYGDLPLIECYPGPLNQVFMNILVNAIDAIDERVRKSLSSENPSPTDPPLVPTIKIRTEVHPHKQITIQIIDNGIGMPAAVQQQIFDPFFTTKPIGKGTGMGLSISHQIVTEKHGGTLHCQSTPGAGTEFIITLPCCQNCMGNEKCQRHSP